MPRAPSCSPACRRDRRRSRRPRRVPGRRRRRRRHPNRRPLRRQHPRCPARPAGPLRGRRDVDRAGAGVDAVRGRRPDPPWRTAGRWRGAFALVGSSRCRDGHRCGWRREGGARAVLHDALERPRPPLVEVEPGAQRFDQHPQILDLDAQPRRLDDEVVEHLEVQRVQLVARLQALADPGEQLAMLGVDRRLQVQRVRDRPDVDEQLEDGAQQLAEAAQDLPGQVTRRAQRDVRVEGELGRELFAREEERGRLVLALEVAEQIGADGAGVEEAIELDGGQLADLRLGVIGPALVPDPRPDLAHDLLDVDVVGADGEIRHGLPATARPNAVRCGAVAAPNDGCGQAVTGWGRTPRARMRSS